jgi:hypothetical protein
MHLPVGDLFALAQSKHKVKSKMQKTTNNLVHSFLNKFTAFVFLFGLATNKKNHNRFVNRVDSLLYFFF